MGPYRLRLLLPAGIAAAAALAASGAAAHHGWGGYDADRTLNLAGTIEASSYENPHGELRLRTPEKVWRVILAPPARMQNRGLPAEMIRPGTPATVVGYPHKTDPVEMRAERITVNGRTVELR